MSNYMYGAMTTTLIVMMIQIFNDNMPNSFDYYVGLLLPF